MPRWRQSITRIYEKNIFNIGQKDNKLAFSVLYIIQNDLICGFSDFLVEKDVDSELF